MPAPTPPSGQSRHGFAAVGVLREAILEGNLEPGEVTTQIALAERFGIGPRGERRQRQSPAGLARTVVSAPAFRRRS